MHRPRARGWQETGRGSRDGSTDGQDHCPETSRQPTQSPEEPHDAVDWTRSRRYDIGVLLFVILISVILLGTALNSPESAPGNRPSTEVMVGGDV